MFFDVSRTSVVAPAEPLLSTTLQDTVFTGNNVHGTTTTDATDKYELRVEYNKDQNVVQVYMVDKDKNDGKKLIGTYNGKDGSFTKTGDFDASVVHLSQSGSQVFIGTTSKIMGTVYTTISLDSHDGKVTKARVDERKLSVSGDNVTDPFFVASPGSPGYRPELRMGFDITAAAGSESGETVDLVSGDEKRYQYFIGDVDAWYETFNLGGNGEYKQYQPGSGR